MSENPEFSKRCNESGIKFVGPSYSTMQLLSSKKDAKELARQCGIPVVPGYSGPDQSTVRLIEEIERIGYPVLVKASMGGGGRVGEQRMIDSRECEFCRTAATSKR